MIVGKHIDVVRYDTLDPRMGRHVEHDHRSKHFAFLTKRARPRKKTTHWTSSAPPLNQGNVGSCTATSLCQWLNTDFAGKVQVEKNGGNYFNQQDALDIYSKATRLDSFPGWYPDEDTGSSGNAACKAARAFGYLTGYSWLFSFGSVQAAIEQTPLMVGTLWTDTMYDADNGLVKVGPIVQSNIVGGHEYLMTGIDWEEEVFEFRQSWGEVEDYKPGGYFAISFRDFVRLIDADGDVTVPKIT